MRVLDERPEEVAFRAVLPGVIADAMARDGTVLLEQKKAWAAIKAKPSNIGFTI